MILRAEIAKISAQNKGKFGCFAHPEAPNPIWRAEFPAQKENERFYPPKSPQILIFNGKKSQIQDKLYDLDVKMDVKP